MNKITVLLADDHAIVRKGLIALLRDSDGIEPIAEARDGQEAIDYAFDLQPDVVVMDITMPRLNGLAAARQITKEYPNIKVVVLSVHTDEEYIHQSFRSGVTGYVVKKSAPEELVAAIKDVHEGQIFLSSLIPDEVVERFLQKGPGASDDGLELLSNREQQVLQLLVEGKVNREVAEILEISVKTVETHRSNIFRKLGIDNLPSLVRFAIRKGIIPLEQN